MTCLILVLSHTLADFAPLLAAIELDHKHVQMFAAHDVGNYQTRIYLPDPIALC